MAVEVGPNVAHPFPELEPDDRQLPIAREGIAIAQTDLSLLQDIAECLDVLVKPGHITVTEMAAPGNVMPDGKPLAEGHTRVVFGGLWLKDGDADLRQFWQFYGIERGLREQGESLINPLLERQRNEKAWIQSAFTRGSWAW
jgi:hypothetical protein